MITTAKRTAQAIADTVEIADMRILWSLLALAFTFATISFALAHGVSVHVDSFPGIHGLSVGTPARYCSAEVMHDAFAVSCQHGH